MKDWQYPRWIAHRGAGTLAPENTMAAFRLGAKHGYRIFECDAKLSADGVPFLMHDPTFDRTTNGREFFGPAADNIGGHYPWGELAKLDAGSWHSRAYAGEPLVTLENLSRFCIANRFLLNIEIKPTPGTYRETGAVVARHAARLWNDEPVPPLLTSFQPEALQGALDGAAHLPRGLLVDDLWDGWFAIAQQLECSAVVCNYLLWDRAMVDRVHAAGMRCLSYTVNDESVAKWLLSLGTDGIITDRVDLFPPT